MSLLKLPVQPLTVLRGVTNGNIQAHLLEDVGPKGQLVGPAARAFRALQFRCLGIGLPLTYTWGGCYRDFARQKALFLERYEPATAVRYWATWSSRRKRWYDAKAHGYGSTYWVKKLVNGRYPATAAAPGTSNHGFGIAIDVAYDSNPANGIGPNDAAYIKGHPQWPAFQSLVSELGFSFELDSEPWHIRYVAGDAAPRAVLDVERFIAAGLGKPSEPTPAPAAPKPAPWPPFDPARGLFSLYPFDKSKPEIRLGAKGDIVGYAQGVYRKDGITVNGRQVVVDNDFGPQTDAATRSFQRRYGLHVDGWVGSQTWSAIDRRA